KPGSSSRQGELAEEGGARGAGDGGEARRRPVGPLVGEHGEEDGLLRVGVEPEGGRGLDGDRGEQRGELPHELAVVDAAAGGDEADRKSTRLNSSHVKISYAVFC